MIPVPVIQPVLAAPSALVVRVQARPVRGLRIILSRRSLRPGLVVTLKARRGRVTLNGLRAATVYTLRARACLRRSCGRWSRRVRVSTLHTLQPPRVIATTTTPEPPIGALPELGMNDLTAATNHPDTFWGDYHTIGMRWARVIVQWQALQPDPGTPDYATPAWRVLDAFMSRAHNEGARILVSVNWPPLWAWQHAPDEDFGGAPTIDSARSFVSLLLGRYSFDAIDWSEPNTGGHAWLPTLQLARILDATYPMLHAAGVEVIAGSWTEAGQGGVTQRNAIRTLGRIYTGRPLSFDSLGFHFYPSLWARQYGVEMPNPAPTDSYLMTEFGRLQHDIDAAFPGQHLRWSITETGWSTPGGYHGDYLTPTQQAAAAVWEVHEASRYTPRLEKILWFLDADQAPNTATRNIYTTGLRDADGSAKPILASLSSLGAAS